LQHHADARARVRVGLDAALVGLALGLLLRTGEALLHQVGLGLLKVTVKLLQRLLAAEDGCARLLAQLFHHLCCNGHVSFLVLIVKRRLIRENRLCQHRAAYSSTSSSPSASKLSSRLRSLSSVDWPRKSSSVAS